MVRLFLVALLIGILGTPAMSKAQMSPLPFKQGDSFPALFLPSVTDGSPVSIRDYRGKKVLLQIFASW